MYANMTKFTTGKNANILYLVYWLRPYILILDNIPSIGAKYKKIIPNIIRSIVCSESIL